MPYLIDGHNLIHHLPDISLEDPDDEVELVHRLRGFAARVRKKCVVVFDEGLPGGTSRLSTHSVKVVFASSSRTNADRILKERIQHTRDAANWTVVSSDREVLQAALDHGMRAMSCPSFADLLARPERTKPHRGEDPNAYVSPDEVDEWLRIFGETGASPPPAADADRAASRPRRSQRAKPPHRPSSSRHKPSQRKPSAADPDPTGTPSPGPKHRPSRKRRPGQSRRLTGHEEDIHLSPEEVDEWLDLFGQSAPDEGDGRGKKKRRRR